MSNKAKETFIGPCSKYIDKQGWTTEIPVSQIEAKGYKRIDKDSVVLTREDMKKYAEDCIAGQETGLDILNALIARGERYEEQAKQARKETAEKFANEVYKELYQLGKIYALPETLDADKYDIFSLTQEIVAKIAKEQFGVEIKE